MKDVKKIDNLFKQKLDGLEIAPSPQAWEFVQKEMKPKRAIGYYWIAASFLLVCGSLATLVSNQDLTSSSDIASSVVFPRAEKFTKLDWIALENQNQITQDSKMYQAKEKSKVTKLQPSINATLPAFADEDIAMAEQLHDSSNQVQFVNHIEHKNENLVPADEPVKERSFVPTVKITYIASAVSNSENSTAAADTTGVMQKIVAFTEKIEPGSMLANIRKAKNDLFSGDFLQKKDKEILNP
ncbi:MAG: hypothetical protein AAF789_09665 [Bacteroidota bacterium]